jgi:hypothetical protein
MAAIDTVYPPEMWALEALMVLQNTHVMANLVHRNFENVVAEQGDVVHTRQPNLFSVSTLANNAAIVPGVPDADDVLITLDQHDYVAFRISYRDLATSISTLVSDFVDPAVIPMAQKIDDALSGELGNPANVTTSVAAATGGLTLANLAEVRGTLRGQQVPMDGSVYLVSGVTHEQELLSIDSFVQANTSGLNPPPQRTGFIRELFGMQVFSDQGVPDDGTTAANPQSLAFHRNAMALVTRPLELPRTNVARAAIAQKDGVGIRVIMSYEHIQLGWLFSYDILYGFKILNAGLATRLVG